MEGLQCYAQIFASFTFAFYSVFIFRHEGYMCMHVLHNPKVQKYIQLLLWLMRESLFINLPLINACHTSIYAMWW